MVENQWFESMIFQIKVIEVKTDCRANHKEDETFKVEYRTADPPLCGEAYIGMHPFMTAMRAGGDMRYLGKDNPNEMIYTCPSRIVRFHVQGIPQCNNCGANVSSLSNLTLIQDPYPKRVCSECIK